MPTIGDRLGPIIDILNEHENPENGNDFDFDLTAMKWRVPNCCKSEKNGENSDYWDIALHAQNEDGETDANGFMCLTYSELLSMLRHLMSGLARSIDMKRKQPQSQSQSKRQPVFAVAIPEGPYLPLAILSSFMLNIVSRSLEEAPIILPLDPDEGKDRIVHMLQDAQPSAILYVRRKDKERINVAIESISSQDNEYILPQMVDMKLLLLLVEDEESISGSTTMKENSDRNKATSSNRISHIVYTSGTTGRPKGCISSLSSLLHYIKAKNKSHFVTSKSNVFLASALPFDPCLSDVLATFFANATLCICPRQTMQDDLGSVLLNLEATHILCTPSLFSNVVSETRNKLGSVEVVALGGEVMSARIRAWWGRRRNEEGKIKLLSTYGVTEACVYQTVGEIFADDAIVTSNNGQDIGISFEGLKVRICEEVCATRTSDTFQLVDVGSNGEEGEIVLEGDQLDDFSGYLNMSEVTKEKFIASPDLDKSVCYRTGDRGFIDLTSNRLHIMGRIGGEEGMVKINGVRVELGEIEHAILDSIAFTSYDNPSHFVIGCVVSLSVLDEEGSKKLTAYCVLSQQCLKEIGIKSSLGMMGARGVICPPGPLLTALRARCKEKVRKGSTPSSFVIIDSIPLTRTGKIDRKALPAIEDCVLLQEVVPEQNASIHLSEYGRCGSFIANELISCLNLHSSQKKMVTTTATFAQLGGDSLAATRIVRAVYAKHYGLQDSRNLGGKYGQFEESMFSATRLIRAKSLGEYIDFLDSSNVLMDAKLEDTAKIIPVDVIKQEDNNDDAGELFDALIQSIAFDQSTIAVALLAAGANPNLREHGRRLGNTSGRVEHKDAFKSNPMHLACAKADVTVVQALLQIGLCNCKSPDSSGTYPIHLACSGLGDGVGTDRSKEYDADEDKRRLGCVRLLLDKGRVPLPMKNSSRQTVLHCAARGGHCILLDYLLDRWKSDGTVKAVKQWGVKCDWQDRWFRTSVHWAVLHNNVRALEILLQHGCNPYPPKPRVNVAKRTSGAIEFPSEMCERLYGHSKSGETIQNLLKRYQYTKSTE